MKTHLCHLTIHQFRISITNPKINLPNSGNLSMLKSHHTYICQILTVHHAIITPINTTSEIQTYFILAQATCRLKNHQRQSWPSRSWHNRKRSLLMLWWFRCSQQLCSRGSYREPRTGTQDSLDALKT